MLEELKNIGPKTIEELKRLNITNISELLNYFPYRYNYYKPENLNNYVENKEIVITGIIASAPKRMYIKRNLNKLSFTFNTGSELINVIIFNRIFLAAHLKVGETITIIGKYNKLKNLFTASDIKLKPILKEELEPVYHLTNNIKRQNFIKLIHQALLKEDNIICYIPDYLMKKYKFTNKESALNLIHKPTTLLDIKKARILLVYEELFSYMLKINYLKKQKQTEDKANIKNFNIEKLKGFINQLSFKLTTDQEKSVEEIIKDFNSTKRMNRLLIGDVGSGKTIVAFLSLYANYLAGYQGAIMVPTEILANQHYKNFLNLFLETGIKAALLTSSVKVKEKKEILKDLVNNKINIIIGTHSILSEDVTFNNLGLVITDEQHRFGVNQRKNLQEKGSKVDVLYMSATPIPRTIALTLYGDTDISQIKTKPLNNKEVFTKLVKEKDIKYVLNEMLDELKKGHQIYVIVPLVDENEELSLENVESIYKKLNLAFNKKVPMEILHGKLKSKAKEEIMSNFNNNKIKILISTTVIEVGIDVKNATTMVIFNAERFGLATLHQLRGRVGRSNLESKCFIISDSETARLKILEESNDGFYISEKDFELRGTGDLFGIKQSGDMNFKIADLKNDYRILLQCKEDSEEFLKHNFKNINLYSNQKKILDSIEFID